MKLDPAVIALLNLDPDQTTVSSASGGGSSSASTFKITTRDATGATKHFFMKTGTSSNASTMFQGEHHSLSAINSIVPTLCPLSHGHGTFTNSPKTSFLVTDYLDLSSRSSSSSSTPSLASKLAKLHSTPAPIPEGYDKPQFGFPVPTCCGDTEQDNTYTSSWAVFYANRRLRFIASEISRNQGSDKELSSLIENTCNSVVPRLLSDNHVKIKPVLVHGDLWSGNAGKAKLPGMDHAQDIIYDSSASYSHSEFELGIMKMFGGFGKKFLDEYHSLVPKTEPVEEYEDRVKMYELYHHLNHYAMFGGGYRSGAISIMRGLVGKHGSDKSEL